MAEPHHHRHDDDDRVDELAERAAQGSPAAWADLVDELGETAWTVARGGGLTRSDAALVTGVTWSRLADRLCGALPPPGVAGWVAATAYREAARVARLDRSGLRPAPTAGVEPVEPQGDDGDVRLVRAFERLPFRCRLLLRVLVTHQLRYRQVGAALRMPIGSIGPTRQRCLAALAVLLEEA